MIVPPGVAGLAVVSAPLSTKTHSWPGLADCGGASTLEVCAGATAATGGVVMTTAGWFWVFFFLLFFLGWATYGAREPAGAKKWLAGC